MKIDVLLWYNLRQGREAKLEKRLMKREKFNRPVGLAMSFIEKKEIKDLQHEALGEDISRYGLGLITKHSLTQGNVLKLLIPININNISLPVFAVVKWSEPYKDKFRAGLQFLA